MTDCELYTSCEPCPMCLGAIYCARPKRVYSGASRAQAATAGFDDEMIYEEIALSPSERRISMEQLLAYEAGEAFRVWVETPDHTDY